VYYVISDHHLGTPQQIVDSAGTVVWKAAFLPFGKAQVHTETITNNIRFPGQYFDAETELHYNWNRYYDPDTGRYLTPDPIGLAGGLNLYAYVGGDPVNFIDPEGLARITGIGNEPIYVHPNDVDPSPSKPHGHIGSPNSKQKVDVNTGKIYKGSEDTGKKLTKKQLKKFREILKLRGLLRMNTPLFLFPWQIDCINNPAKCMSQEPCPNDA
jgi:RHS repeat-associated protein